MNVWKKFHDGSIVEDMSQLNSFLLLTFADLKKYRFYYWFAFPALLPAQPIQLVSPARGIADEFTVSQLDSIRSSVRLFRSNYVVSQTSFFLVGQSDGVDEIRIAPLSAYETYFFKANEKVSCFYIQL